MENTKIANSKILKNITDLKSEIKELKGLMNTLLKDKSLTIKSESISELIDSIVEKNETCYILQKELINRNYAVTLDYNGQQFKPIELLKLKEKLMQEKEIYSLFTEANITPEDDKMLKLSLQNFQHYQAIQKELNKVYEILETYNKEAI